MQAGTLTLVTLAALTGYSLAAMAYVWRFRGATRYPLADYLRKSWPVFAPLNCVLYLTTRRWARGAVLDPARFDGTRILREHWEVIRDEALQLVADSELEKTGAHGSPGSYDVGFRTFHKRGWRKFYLQWYGTRHASAERLCPRTMLLLGRTRGVRAAMFSLLPPGAELSLHSDPMACALRYHLGLSTPGTADCRIVVDGQTCVWRDGDAIVFDETFPHFAENRSDQPRLILMCDIERPTNAIGRTFNRAYGLLAAGMLVPNTTEDRRCPFSALFATLAPVLAAGQRLRARRRWLYRIAKTAVNLALLGLLMLPVGLALFALERVAAG